MTCRHCRPCSRSYKSRIELFMETRATPATKRVLKRRVNSQVEMKQCWPGTELNDSAAHGISKLLIALWTRRTLWTAKTSVVCVLCAVFAQDSWTSSRQSMVALRHVSRVTLLAILSRDVTPSNPNHRQWHWSIPTRRQVTSSVSGHCSGHQFSKSNRPLCGPLASCTEI